MPVFPVSKQKREYSVFLSQWKSDHLSETNTKGKGCPPLQPDDQSQIFTHRKMKAKFISARVALPCFALSK